MVTRLGRKRASRKGSTMVGSASYVFLVWDYDTIDGISPMQDILLELLQGMNGGC